MKLLSPVSEVFHYRYMENEMTIPVSYTLDLRMSHAAD